MKRPLSLGRWRWPSGRLGSHILHLQLGAPLEQAVGVFGGIVDPGWRERDATFFEHVFAQGQSVQAGRSAAVPGAVIMARAERFVHDVPSGMEAEPATMHTRQP